MEIQFAGTPMPGLGACLECIAVYKVHVNNLENVANEVPPPAINYAVSSAPAWQSQQIAGQTLFACVAVPACMGHLGVTEPTVQQRAARSGLFVPGTSG